MDAGLLMSKHGARSPESSRNFIYDQKHVMLAANAFDPLECIGRMKSHSNGHLNQGLNNNSCQLILAFFNKQIEGGFNFISFRNRLWELLQQKPFEVRMHAVFWITYAHRACCVAVVCVLKTDEFVAGRLSSRRTIRPMLHRHLHGH